MEESHRPATSLRADVVSRSFEGVVALADVTLELASHEVVGLIGPNGAGKSTLVNVLSGFDRPASGRVLLEGNEITAWPPHRRGRAGLARTFQHARSYAGLSVRENIEVSALGVGASATDARSTADRLLELLDLTDVQDSPASILPHGAERKLGVARALATEPRFVLMDEPAAGLNEAEVPDFADVVRSVRDDHNAGVLLIDHNMALIMAVSDRVHVLDEGHTIAEGTAQEVRTNAAVASVYLGAALIEDEDGE